MKRLLIYIICVSVAVSSFSQSIYSEQASEYAENNDYENAIRLETKGLELLKKSVGKNDIKYINALYNLAIYYSCSGKFNEADDIFHQIENAQIAIDMDDNYDYYEVLNLTAQYYEDSSLFDQAIPVRQKLMKQMDEAGWDKSALDYFSVVDALAADYNASGKYKEALKLTHEMVDTYKKLTLIDKSNNQSLYTESLIALAETYSYLGNYDRSIELVKEALDNIAEINPYEAPSYWVKLKNNLANYYDECGQPEEALKIQKEIIKYLSEVLTEDDETYIISIALLGRYLLHAGQTDAGLPLLMQAADLWEQYQDINHPYFQHIQSSIETAYREMGKYEEAIQIAESMRDNYRRVYGEIHPYFIQSETDLLTLYVLSGKTMEIKRTLTEIMPIVSNNIRYNFAYLTSKERSDFWKYNNLIIKYIIPAVNFRFPEIKSVAEGYDACLLSKGILLNSERTLDEFVSTVGDSEMNDMSAKIRNLRRGLTSLSTVPISERTVSADSIQQELFMLERQLMEKASEYGDYTHALTATWEDVKNSLKEQDAAVEFVSLDYHGKTQYMAYLLRNDSEAPELINLYDESELLKHDSKDFYENEKASDLIWGKLIPHLGGIKNIYFAPDGKLNQIAIENMSCPGMTGLISDQYNLFRLSSTREIALCKDKKKSKDAVIYGGISYDSDMTGMVSESRKYREGATRGSRLSYNIPDSVESRGSMEYLEHTKTEAEEIDKLLSANGYTPVLFMGKDASEESFRNLDGRHKGIIHIATHGFCWDRDEAGDYANKNDKLRFMVSKGDSNNLKNTDETALVRTGLYMAGVNNILQGKDVPASVEDGILTAQEIANLDLSGLDLVVLSACRTGMGEIGEDGVFGLQRGFKKAGANSILMSLWNVNDEATQMLMSEFYRHYTNGESKHESLRRAQEILRNDPKYFYPKYWAGFILLDGLN